MAIGDGLKHQNKIFFYDFAFGEPYLNAVGEPKRREKVTDMDGTPSYFAIDPLRGQSHVRKDELFSFGICLLDMNNADLPWMEKSKEIVEIFKAMSIILNEWEKHGIEVRNTKLNFTFFEFNFCFFLLQEICNTSDNPELFLEYFNYLDSIESHETPDYDRLIDLFARQLTTEEMENLDLGIFDSDNEPDKIELEAQLLGKVIDGRFEIRNYLRSEFAVFVHNGRNFILNF